MMEDPCLSVFFSRREQIGLTGHRRHRDSQTESGVAEAGRARVGRARWGGERFDRARWTTADSGLSWATPMEAGTGDLRSGGSSGQCPEGGTWPGATGRRPTAAEKQQTLT
jgi:hypothetical protein